MTDPESHTLAYLRQIDAKLDRALEDLQEVKLRVTSLDQRLALQQGDMARIDARIDRIEQRLIRIERRLELVEVEAPA